MVSEEDKPFGDHFAITIKYSGNNGFLGQFDGYLDGDAHISNGKKIQVTEELNKYIGGLFNE